MAKTIKIISISLICIFVALVVLYQFVKHDAVLSTTITIGVFAYHFVMRLLVGVVVNAIFKNNINYNKWWFREKRFEPKLYSILKVKKWKKHMPTYAPDAFDPQKHTLEEIVGATCQSEIVHEIIIILSFLPILLYIPYGTLAVFIITSIIAALFDLIFVIMQRFNRPRLIKIINRKNQATR